MTELNNSKSTQITSEAYLEEIRILQRKVDRQDAQIRQIAKKAGVELPE
jgi:hypothetical protein